MTRFVFCHSNHKITLTETDITFDTVREYSHWFCYDYAVILYKWMTLMDWKKEIINNTIEIQCETKQEGYTTLCITQKDTNNFLYIPFHPYMTYEELRKILTLFIPHVEYIFYLLKENMYYTPKHDLVFIPQDYKKCVIDDSVYPLKVVFMKTG